MAQRGINRMEAAEEKLIIAGFGGQGIMLTGKLLAYAGMMEERHVTYMPSYGAEVRGGTANCSVTISSEEIASPIVSYPTALTVMNAPSMDRFEPRVVQGGLIVANSSLIKRAPRRKDIEYLEIPATDMANKLGNIRAANMVILGAYLATRRVVDLSHVSQYLKDVLPSSKHNLLDINRKALEQGKEFALAAIS